AAKVSELIGADRLFEPGDVKFRNLFCKSDRVPRVECPIGVDEKVSVGSDRFARDAHPIDIRGGLRSDLHLDALQIFRHPAGQLRDELPIVVGGESAASISCYTGLGGAEKIDERE